MASGCAVVYRYDTLAGAAARAAAWMAQRGVAGADIAECSEDATARPFYTSGTTGKPEGVMLTHRNLRWATMAYVVLREAVVATTLDAHCLEHVARYKRPKHDRFVDALPKNNYGKVLKTELREREAALAATPAPLPASP